jgi:uroporphyrinogen decarboxylase
MKLTAMNGRERVMAAIELRIPDRVPLGESLIDDGIRRALYPDASLLDFLELIDRDLVVAYRGRRYETLSDGLLRDEWGVLFKKSGEHNPHPLAGPLRAEADLDDCCPTDSIAAYMLDNLRAIVARFKGQRAIGFQMLDVFTIPCFLRGMETFLMDMIDRPEFARRLIDLVTEYQLKLLEGAIREGADIIQCGCDYAHKTNTLMSPAQFEEFIQPNLTRIVERTHELGARFMKHTDGHIWPILEQLVATGADILQPFEPNAGMDIGEVKRHYGRRVCLMGNIDCSFILSQAGPDEVVEAVRACLAAAAPGGGFILSSSNSIHSGVKPENYLAMLLASRELGAYN